MKNTQFDSFWNTDLEDLIEGNIQDKRTILDPRVPAQGHVMLDRVILIDMPSTTFIEKAAYKLGISKQYHKIINFFHQ